MIKRLAILLGVLTASRLLAGGLAVESVRNVEVRDAPEAQALAERARRIGNAVYPQILELLGDGKLDMPRQLDIVFREHLPRGPAGEWSGLAYRGTVFLNAAWLCDHPEDLDPLLVHEMAHVAQNYPNLPYWHVWQQYHYLGFIAAQLFRAFPLDTPPCWEEGIADYVCAKLGHTNLWKCPQCNESYPHYTTGYSCTAAFLLYLDAACASNITCQLNAALRRGTYSDQFFVQATGKTLDALWEDFQKTPAYTPAAADVNELHQALGYVNGKPPKDLQPRLDKYFGKHPEIKDFFTRVGWWHGAKENVQEHIEAIIYMRQQPGGEQTLLATEAALDELHQALGFAEGKPPKDYQARLLAYLEAHPEIKEFCAAHGRLEGKPSPKIQGEIEGFILVRLQPGGKTTVFAAEFLTRLKDQGKLPGWRKSEHGVISFKLTRIDTDTYPAYRTFECRKNGSSEFYIYTVVENSPDGDCKLRRAGETTAKGRLLKEFLVP
jgi:hypothetical protein